MSTRLVVDVSLWQVICTVGGLLLSVAIGVWHINDQVNDKDNAVRLEAKEMVRDLEIKVDSLDTKANDMAVSLARTEAIVESLAPDRP